MSDEKEKTSDIEPWMVPGCLGAMLSIFGVRPLWFMLVFGILMKIDADPWMWVLFVTYVPLTFVVNALGEWTKVLYRQRK